MTILTSQWLAENGIAHTINSEGLTVGGWLDLEGTPITALPEGLTVGGNLYLRGTSITALPESLTVGGWLDLEGAPITALPEGLTVGGNLYLRGTSITALPEGLTVGGWLNLRGTSITALPEGLTVGGWLDLEGTPITALPEGLTVGGNLYLRGTSITALPESLTVGGWLDLEGDFEFRGKTYTAKIIDGLPCVLGQRLKSFKPSNVRKAYFLRDIKPNKPFLSKDKRCYIAQDGEFYAHGETPEKAIDDLNFKVLNETKDKSEIAEMCVADGNITVNRFRLLTGACELGTKSYLAEKGVDLSTTKSLPIDEAVSIARGGYRFDRFINHLKGAGYTPAISQ